MTVCAGVTVRAGVCLSAPPPLPPLASLPLLSNSLYPYLLSLPLYPSLPPPLPPSLPPLPRQPYHPTKSTLGLCTERIPCLTVCPTVLTTASTSVCPCLSPHRRLLLQPPPKTTSVPPTTTVYIHGCLCRTRNSRIRFSSKAFCFQQTFLLLSLRRSLDLTKES